MTASRSRGLLVIVTLLTLAGLGYAAYRLFPGPLAGARQALVAEIQYEVSVREAAGAAWRAASVGQILPVGGGVRTGAEARARVDVSDGTRMRLGPNTEFALVELSPKTENGKTRWQLGAGKVWLFVAEALGQGSFEVETPLGVATVRGSYLGLDYTPAAGHLVATCLDGACRLTGSTGAFTDLATGQQSEIAGAGQPPSPEHAMDADRLAEWAREYPEVRDIVATLTPAPPTSTPIPTGEVDAAMGGSLAIGGTVRDNSGAAAPDVYVTLTVYDAGGGGDQGVLWNGELFTDGAGRYAFNGLARVAGGHYEVWFNGRQEFGRAYENSGYYLFADQISGEATLLNVTVHRVTGSALTATIQYEDADGITKDFLSRPLSPDHFVGLGRGTAASPEYAIGSEYITTDGSRISLSGLAGGTYFLHFQYIRSDGVRIETVSPPIEIPPGVTRLFDYTIPLDAR